MQRCTSIASIVTSLLLALTHITSDVLPILRFQLEEGIDPDEAVKLIGSESRQEIQEVESNPKWEEETTENFEKLQLNDDRGFTDPSNTDQDPFTIKVTSLDEEEYSYRPITVGKAALRKLQLSEVFIAKDLTGVKFYRDFHNEQSHVMCPDCHKVRPEIEYEKLINILFFEQFFTRDEWERHILGEGSCPFCRTPTKLRKSSIY